MVCITHANIDKNSEFDLFIAKKKKTNASFHLKAKHSLHLKVVSPIMLLLV
jgi:hypothetical protein